MGKKLKRSYMKMRIIRELNNMLSIHFLHEYNRMFRGSTKDSPNIEKDQVDWGK